jgi:hypothetical protein
MTAKLTAHERRALSKDFAAGAKLPRRRTIRDNSKAATRRPRDGPCLRHGLFLLLQYGDSFQ